MKNLGQPTGNIHPRLATTMALIPITAGVEILCYFAHLTWGWNFALFSFGGAYVSQVERLVSFASVAVAIITPPILVYVAPLAIWWSTVAWTPRRRRGVWITTAVWMLLLAVAVVLAVVLEVLGILLALIVGTIGGVVCVLIALRICWSRGPINPGPVLCRNCSYDLRGQQSCRCPECGAQYTLGELVRSDRPYDSLTCRPIGV